MEEEIFNSTQQQTEQLPKNIQKSMLVDHFAVVCSNLSILGLALCVVIMLAQTIFVLASALAMILVFCVLIFVVAITLGIILVDEGFRSLFGMLSNWSDNTIKISEFLASLYALIPYFSAAVIALSITSLLCFKFNKSQRHPARFTFSIIALTLCAIIIVLYLIGVGGAK